MPSTSAVHINSRHVDLCAFAKTSHPLRIQTETVTGHSVTMSDKGTSDVLAAKHLDVYAGAGTLNIALPDTTMNYPIDGELLSPHFNHFIARQL